MSGLGRKLPLGGGVDAEFAELAVEGRATNPEAPGDFCHAAAIMADGEADDIGLDLLERAQMAVAGEHRYGRRAGESFVAVRLAENRREIAAAAREARLDRDVREMLGGERASVALQPGAEQHPGELAEGAPPAETQQPPERGM